MRLFLIILIFVTLLVFLRLVMLRMKMGAVNPTHSAVPVVIDAAEIPSSPIRLNGKVAIVTGAGSGIGRATAIAFAREGARVVLVGRTKSKLDVVAKEIGDAALVCAGDVTKRSDIQNIVARTMERFGAVHVLMNNAAYLVAGTATSLTEVEWDATFDTNVKGLWMFCQEVIPRMRLAHGGPGGSIINISSVLGLVGTKNRVAYAASKGAVTLMTKAMALDHAVENIRVNCICPGIVDTEMVAEFITKAPDLEAARRQREALHPLGRFGTPEDIAHLAVYLASDESSWVTGAAIPIDGGYTAI